MSKFGPGEDHRQTVALTLVAWLCSLPLLLLIAVPFLGWSTTATIALVWLAVLVVACFGICLWRLPWRARQG